MSRQWTTRSSKLNPEQRTGLFYGERRENFLWAVSPAACATRPERPGPMPGGTVFWRCHERLHVVSNN